MGETVIAGIDRGKEASPPKGGALAYWRTAVAALATPLRGGRRRSAGLLCVLLGACLVASSPALGATQRGHAFSFAFGAPGAGSAEFAHPSGIAVSSASGDVYVADRENNRVEQFKPTLGKEGELVGEEYVTQFTVPHPGAIAVDNCTHGSSPCTELEDSSVGDVYVLGTGKRSTLLYKFSAAGASVGATHKFKSTPEGVAVAPSGTLFVYQESGAIARFNDAVENVAEEGVQAGIKQGALPAFAVDASGDFYVGAVLDPEEAGADEGLRSLLNEMSREYSYLHQAPSFPTVAKLEGATGTVTVPELDYEPTTAVAVNTGEAPADGVAELNDSYVLNVASVAGEQVTTVAAFGPEAEGASLEDRHGQLIQRFGAPGLKEGDAIAVDTQSGAVYVADAASGSVDVFELEPEGQPKIEGVSATTDGVAGATTLNAQVNPENADTHAYFEYGNASCAASPGACMQTPAMDIGTGFGARPASAELHNLPPGVYHYRVVVENSFGSLDSAEQTFAIADLVSGLPDGRAWEMVSPPDKDGAEPEPMTLEGGAIQAAADGRAISYVADGPIPATGEPEGSRNPEYTQVLSTRASGGWDSQDITTANTEGAGTRGGFAPEYQFFSRNLALSIVEPEISDHEGSLAAPPLSPALPGEEGKQETTSYLRRDAPLEPEDAAEGSEEQQNYEKARENGARMTPSQNVGFVPLVTHLNSPTPQFGANSLETGVKPEGATPDLSHVVLQLTKRNPPEDLAGSGLYEWGGAAREQTLTLVSELPDGQHLYGGEAVLGGDPQAGYGGADTRHAISNNGSLVFWSDRGALNHLYVRETTVEPARTVQIDVVNESEPPPEASERDPAGAQFQIASADGSKVFFTDTQRLTANSKAIEGAPDLYVFELNPPAGRPPVTDLTAEAGAGVVAVREVQGGGGVLGASEDGSYVYFVANGALTAGATRGHCPPESREQVVAGTTCNLYMRHYNAAREEWEPTELIAVLSEEDRPDWGSRGGKTSSITSRVSPKGGYLAFMSKRSLTGYDNEDVSSQAKGERLDEEVYLYDAASKHLVCASCDPSGARPQGVFDAGGIGSGSGEGLGLLVDRKQVWAAENKKAVDPWLAGSIPGWTALDQARAPYQSRYLSDSGRLFFDAAGPLAALAKPTRTEIVAGKPGLVGVENVYEYQPAATGGCDREGGCVGLISSGTSEHESAFLDASETGNDVFFLTAAPLAPQDRDTNFDVYDAHICEAGSPCPAPAAVAPPGCQGEACQGSYSPGSPFAAPASTLSGIGNIGGEVLGQKVVVKAKQPTRAQELAAALKLCRSEKRNSARRACEARARKKYGPTRAQRLAGALRACKKDSQKARRLTCETQARKRYGPIKPRSTQSPGKGKR